MTLDKLMQVVNDAYGEGTVAAYHEEPDGHHGDSLAAFVATEIAETFDEDAETDDQIAEAIRVMERGAEDLTRVANGLAGHQWDRKFDSDHADNNQTNDSGSTEGIEGLEGRSD